MTYYNFETTDQNGNVVGISFTADQVNAWVQSNWIAAMNAAGGSGSYDNQGPLASPSYPLYPAAPVIITGNANYAQTTTASFASSGVLTYNFQYLINGAPGEVANIAIPGSSQDGSSSWQTPADYIQVLQSTAGLLVTQYQLSGASNWTIVYTPPIAAPVATSQPTQTSSVMNNPVSSSPASVNTGGTVYRLILQDPSSSASSGYVYDSGASYPGCSEANSDACQPVQFATLQDAINYAVAHNEIPVQVASADDAWAIIAGTMPVPAPLSTGISMTEVAIGALALWALLR